MGPSPAAASADPAKRTEATRAEVFKLEPQKCALCGASLKAPRLHYSVTSPRACADRLSVCHTCRNDTRSEGYRPVA